MATFTKLNDGSWGVKLGRDDMRKAKTGEMVSVKTKAGQIKDCRIAKVLSKGADYALCSIVSDRAPARSSARGSGREDCRKYGWDGRVGSSSYYSSGQYDEDS